MRKWRSVSLLLILGAITAFTAITFSHSRADSVPTTAPTISPEARQLLDQVHEAYASLKSLAISGTLTADFDIDNVKAANTAKFSGLYSSTGQFRSEMSNGDAVVCNPGDKVYVFLPQKNRYDMIDTPKGQVHLDALGDDITDLLCQQNLSLALALSNDPATTISRDATSIVRTKDVEIDGHPFPAISVTSPGQDNTLIIDPATHLLRRSVTDQTKAARAQGAQVVKSAQITTDYVNTPAAVADAARFAWTPPPGAQPNASDNTGADIEGKPAPAFSLTALDGTKVDLKSLKGSVCVFDFWASWCGPCCASLPHLDAIYQDFKPQGVRFFAINLQEDQKTVQSFVKDTKLSIPVLLDSDGKVTSEYDTAGGIPFTVVVGKDGTVLKAGFFGGNEVVIRPVIQSALKK